MVYQAIKVHAERDGIAVERTILHKRRGTGPALRGRHPFYRGGADYLIVDDHGAPVAAIERKSLDDLARSLGHGAKDEAPRLFRQICDLKRYPMPILLVEGGPTPVNLRMEPAILGLQFWCAREGVAVVYASSTASAARAVVLYARKLRQEPTWSDAQTHFSLLAAGPQGPRDPAA
jgi:hypothetical protein